MKEKEEEDQQTEPQEDEVSCRLIRPCFFKCSITSLTFFITSQNFKAFRFSIMLASARAQLRRHRNAELHEFIEGFQIEQTVQDCPCDLNLYKNQNLPRVLRTVVLELGLAYKEIRQAMLWEDRKVRCGRWIARIYFMREFYPLCFKFIEFLLSLLFVVVFALGLVAACFSSQAMYANWAIALCVLLAVPLSIMLPGTVVDWIGNDSRQSSWLMIVGAIVFCCGIGTAGMVVLFALHFQP